MEHKATLKKQLCRRLPRCSRIQSLASWGLQPLMGVQQTKVTPSDNSKQFLEQPSREVVHARFLGARLQKKTYYSPDFVPRRRHNGCGRCCNSAICSAFQLTSSQSVKILERSTKNLNSEILRSVMRASICEEGSPARQRPGVNKHMLEGGSSPSHKPLDIIPLLAHLHSRIQVQFVRTCHRSLVTGV